VAEDGSKVTIRKKASDDDTASNRWHGRPVLSWLVSLGVFAVPITLSIVSATITAHVLPSPHGVGRTMGWWVVVLTVPTIVLVGADRLARKAMPLAVLLKMTMVFPDKAPKRLGVARKAGNTRDLARRVEEAKAHGIEDEPVLAAEKILALAGALNAHDRLTRGHGERVRAFTDLIADELDLPASARDRLRWSALLHDIGKLTVHPHILNKPDKLSAEEWEVIKNHPLEGAKLTAPLAGWLGPWANTIAEHHEKYDGTGYPYGLTGEEISLGGRIVAVADCYDTMTAVRSYKRAMSPEAARTELAACAGTHFDPKVVRAFLDVSIGRLRPVAGPISWLGSLPFLGNVSHLGQAVSALTRVGAASATLAGAVTAGSVQVAASATTVPHQTISSQHALPKGAVSKGSSTGTTQPSANGTKQSTGPTSLPAGTAQSGTGSSGASSTPTTVGRSGSSTPGSTVAGAVPGTSTTTTMTKTPTTTTAATTTVPMTGPRSLVIRNGGAQAGRPQQGDQIVVTFSPVPSPSAICSAWNAGSYPDLVSQNVVVQGVQPSSGDDTVTVTDDADCGGSLHFGTIDLGQRGYFNGNVTFGGKITGGGPHCNGGQTAACSRVHWDGSATLTITLGQESSGQPTQGAPSVAVYTPDPALGLLGIISSVREENF
jgi:hypothetical protein